jgi:dTDP-4-amino-4,6-dideoxygalactose transaminase
MMSYSLPPAETSLPLRAIAKGLLPGRADFALTLRQYLNADACIVTNSGRAALYLLFSLLRTRVPGGMTEVLIPGYTCYSVAAAAVKAELKVALYDLDPCSFQPDMADVRRKIRPATVAVVGQHLLGVPGDIGALSEVAREYGICCIEDSAQLLGRTDAGAQWKTPADYTVLSFGRGKPLPLGGGGAVIASEPRDLSQIVGGLRASRLVPARFLMPLAVRALASPRLYWILENLPLGLGRTVYDPSFSVADMPLAYQRIGSAALARLDCLNRHRVDIGDVYNSHFAGEINVAPMKNRLAHTRYPLLVRNQSAIRQLAAYGVRRLYPLALCDLPALQSSLVCPGEQLRGAREIASRLITLPTHMHVDQRLANELVNRVSATLQGVTVVQTVKQPSVENESPASLHPCDEQSTVNMVV